MTAERVFADFAFAFAFASAFAFAFFFAACRGALRVFAVDVGVTVVVNLVVALLGSAVANDGNGNGTHSKEERQNGADRRFEHPCRLARVMLMVQPHASRAVACH